MSLLLRNPHSVLAVLETRPGDVTEITVPTRSAGEAWTRVLHLAEKHRIPVRTAGGPRGGSDRGSHRGPRPGARPVKSGVSEESPRMGLAEAAVRERVPVPVEELFRGAPQRKQGKGLWLALDCLQDPHNVGAIFRAAAFFGVEGILLTQERSAPLTSTVYDVASGGMEYVPFTVQTNLQRAFEVAKESGLWILGTSEHAHDSHMSMQLDRPWLLVVGNEEKGMRRLTEDSCDLLCRIAGTGKVTSLNVSVAVGILIQRFAQ